MQESEYIKKIRVRMILIGILVVSVFTAISFGFYYMGASQKGESGVSSLTCFDVSFTDKDSINLSNALSVSDKDGLKSTPYHFTLTNNCDTDVNYYVLLNIKDNSFSEDYVSVSLNGESPSVVSSNKENNLFGIESGYKKSYILAKGTLKKDNPVEYDTRLWINATTTYEQVKGKSFEAQIKVVNVVKELDEIENSPSGKTLKALGISYFDVKTSIPDFTTTAPEPATWEETDFTSSTLSTTITENSNTYYTYAESYSFNSNNKTYTLINPQVCKYSECYETLKGKYVTNRNGLSSNNLDTYSNLAEIYLVDNKSTSTSLQTKNSQTSVLTYSSVNDGIYSMEDDYGISYYYRGAVTNNYVKFGTWKEGDNSDKPMYWRIIRINGDGSVRMQYDGTSAHANGEASEDRVAMKDIVWNLDNSDDNKYLGYMYGGANGVASTKRINLGEEGYEDSENAVYNETDSNAKKVLEEWYRTNLLNLDSSIADVIYCNDRTIEIGTGIGGNATRFKVRGRKYNGAIIFKCPEKNDAFTKEDTRFGNGKLNNKIGLINLDEIIASGGNYDNQNIDFYLNKGFKYQTMSPDMSMGGYGPSKSTVAGNNIVKEDGTFGPNLLTSPTNLAPVISLTPEYVSTLIGDGTAGNPYRAPNEEP